jgi:hypothetical protein
MRKIYLTFIALIALTLNAYSDNNTVVEMNIAEADVDVDANADADADAMNTNSTYVHSVTSKDSIKTVRSQYISDKDFDINFDALKYNPPREELRTNELKPITSINYGVSTFEPRTLNLNNNSASSLYKLDGKNYTFSDRFKRNTRQAERWERWKVIGLYSAAIICNGIGDGMNNTHRKTWGHIFNSASIAMLVASPFVVKYDTKKWYWYLLTYTSLRLALFDATYNVTTNQPIDFIGSTAITDKMYKAVGVGYDLSKTVGFVVGLSIPLRIL